MAQGPTELICILGGRGRLGRALMRAYADRQILAPPRELYENWSNSDRIPEIREHFSQLSQSSSALEKTVFVTAGILDPKAPPEAHLRVNYELPMNVIEAVSDLGFRVVTFGTILEEIGGITNNYVESKRRLGRFADQLGKAGPDVTHFRFHTMFGGNLPPSEFMFLGLILQHLIDVREFHMTSGTQLREYHHFDDDVLAVKSTLLNRGQGCISVNHGNPIRLRDLASQIFEAFGVPHLLKIGSVADPKSENREMRFRPSDYYRDVKFRDTSTSVIEYLNRCYARAKGTELQCKNLNANL